MRIYLAGPIFGKSDAECSDWRNRFKALKGHEWVDPMDRDMRGKEEAEYAAIVEGDKDAIDTCDAVVVMAEQPSWGTAMEVIWAWLGHRDVTAICSKPSPWLRYHCARIFPTIDDALDHFA